MQRYIEQLIEDLDRAAENPPDRNINTFLRLAWTSNFAPATP